MKKMHPEKLMYGAVVGGLHAAVLKVVYPMATCILQVGRYVLTDSRLLNIGQYHDWA